MAETEKKKYDEYIESDAVRAAKTNLEQQMAQKPGAYQSQWQNSLNEAMNKILNREKFSYDLNGDALYNQYKDRYVQQGKQAMQDTIGSASALTGGYGNSWAQSAGQQAYHGYLQGLNDKVPELYQMALDKYNMEGQNLLNQYGLLSDREGQDYGRYRDALSDYLTERNFLTDRYDTERNYDYGMFSDNRDFNYTQDRDAVADQQWQAEFDEAIKRFLATSDPATRAYYENYGKEPSTGGANGIGGILSGLLSGNGGTIASVISSILGSTGGKIGGKTSSGYSGTEGKTLAKTKTKTESLETETPETVKSSFEQVTGSSRYDNVGTNFTEEEYKAFDREVGMNRTKNGKANTITDALMEGKITEKQADELQKKYNISDEEYAEAIGMVEGLGQGSYTQIGKTDLMEELLKKRTGGNLHSPSVSVR